MRFQPWHTPMHEALKQFTKRHESTCSGNRATFDAGGRFCRTLPCIGIPVTNRTQGWSKGWQGQSQKAQSCQEKDYRPKGRSGSLEKAEVISLPSELPACHNGGPNRAHGSAKEIRFIHRQRQHATTGFAATQKRLCPAKRKDYRLGLTLCRYAGKTDPLTISRQIRNANIRLGRNSPKAGNVSQVERYQDTRGQLELGSSKHSERPTNKTCSRMA